MSLVSEFGSFLPLLSVVVAALLGYQSGRLLELRKQLVQQKGQSYGDYLKALSTSAVGTSPKDAILAATDAKVRICIYGSPSVIAKLGGFEAAGARIIDATTRALIAELIVAMRRDVGTGTSNIDNAHLNLILFGPPR